MKPVALPMALAGMAAAIVAATPASAEILAMMNYESKTDEVLAEMNLPHGPGHRREGIAIIDVDPESMNFGRILMDIPIEADFVAHHIFYNRDMTTAYVTSLAQPALRVIDLTANPFRVSRIELPGCVVGEDVWVSDDNSTFWVTCMGSDNVIVGDAVSNTVTGVIETPAPHPHGISVHAGIDRMLVTSTVRATDLQDPGGSISVIEASTGTPLGSIPVAGDASAGTAPVEVVFARTGDPVAYITNMYGASLSAAVWDGDAGDFDVSKVFDFEPTGEGVPLEIYFNDAGDRLYVTTASPGAFHIFAINGPGEIELLNTIPTAGGGHHVAFDRDFRYAFVQNAFINLPGMSDGSVSVIDLETEEVIASMDTLKEMGLNPNSIVLLPEWNHFAGH